MNTKVHVHHATATGGSMALSILPLQGQHLQAHTMGYINFVWRISPDT
eukprot:CAMPEP_0195300594 /NCGR_PEP_ID=MMETSP0707-20130614/27758_1 /TAXON_ID=33640 /ORGANISM="Asterionellopsis glacialis, Strain CCMP134" /LENGTH=47 /DNA_ID= /DNA_START= /DNA_END= /DNA_ORIENTATION=